MGTTILVCHSIVTALDPSCITVEAGQPRQPNNVQSFQHLRSTHICTWHLATKEVLDYLSDLCKVNR